MVELGERARSIHPMVVNPKPTGAGRGQGETRFRLAQINLHRCHAALLLL